MTRQREHGERIGAAGGDRWQGGECGTYATALQRTRPSLMIGAAGGGPGDDEEDWDVEHFFAHDQTHAYDSTGRHELPYSGRWQHSILNINPHHFDVLSAEHPPDSDEAERAITQAERHIIRHRILEGGERTQHPGLDPLEDRRPGGVASAQSGHRKSAPIPDMIRTVTAGSLDELPPSDLDELPPSDLDATNPLPGRRRPPCPPGTRQHRHLRKSALPHEGELEAGM